jgi:hypothetical protein
MKELLLATLLGLVLMSAYAQPGRTEPLIIDHTSASKFTTIPDSILTSIIAQKLMFRHTSVGTTINNGLNCIQGTRTNPAECKLFPPYKYDRRNWVYELRGNSGWYGKITDFVNAVNIQIDTYDIFGFKYCYLDGLDQVGVPCGGSNFSPTLVKKAWDSLRTNMDYLENKYPDKLFVWWTIPLTQPGQRCTDTLNYLMRNYAQQNKKILFDIADIQSWDTLNQHLTNANGWEMAFSGYCGEKPPGPSCHPNWTGSIILGKAFWWMMASLAGILDSTETDTTPTLLTTAITGITKSGAVSGGYISSDGGKAVTARGVVWSTSPNPDIILSTKTTDGAGTGSFTSNITNLNPNTKYYVRAYATNSIGTAYGNELNFNTNLNSINENELRLVSIHPNPAKNTFCVNVPPGVKQIQILNASGKLIRSTDAYGKLKYDFEIDENGIYFIQIITETQKITKRLVVLKY